MMLTGCGRKQAEEEKKAQEAAEEARLAEEQRIREEQEAEARRREEEERAKQEEIERQQAEEAAKKLALTIVIDPGHSGVVAGGTEPLGPGSSEYKAADASGTRGTTTGVPEYELTLTISLQLKNELEARGYTVLLTRESNDVPLSCVQRAETANQAGAAAFVRIHANGSESSDARGAMTICTTPQSPYVPELYAASRQLSDCIITKLCEATGCENDGVWETDSMSGNNWSKVPATIVEMGYMTNPEEDLLMQTPEYQLKITQGIADGIDAFLGY